MGMNSDHHRGARRQQQSGQQRGVAEPLLRHHRDDHVGRIEDRADPRHHHHADAEIAVLQAAQIDHRLLDHQQPGHAADDPHRRQQREKLDAGRIEPVAVLAAIQHDLQRAEPERDQRQPAIVDVAHMRAIALHPGRILHQLRHGDECEDADRHVDQEHPAPRIVVGDPAPQHRPDDRREDHRDRHQRKPLRPLRRFERIQYHRLLATAAARRRTAPAAAGTPQAAAGSSRCRTGTSTP